MLGDQAAERVERGGAAGDVVAVIALSVDSVLEVEVLDRRRQREHPAVRQAPTSGVVHGQVVGAGRIPRVQHAARHGVGRDRPALGVGGSGDRVAIHLLREGHLEWTAVDDGT